MTDDNIKIPEFSDPLIKRNYYLVWHYILFILDSGINYLKREYIKRNSDSPFQRLSATSYFNFILKDYMRGKVKNQMKAVLNASILCVEYMDDEYSIDPDKLDEIVIKKYPKYLENDMTLRHTSETHPGHQELAIISKLSFRVAVLQVTRLFKCQEGKIKTYDELARYTFPTFEEGQQSINAILSMVDQMIDCFERNLGPNSTLITIPFYKPTFSLRDFQYIRGLYEYAIEVIDDQLRQIYQEEENNER